LDSQSLFKGGNLVSESVKFIQKILYLSDVAGKPCPILDSNDFL